MRSKYQWTMHALNRMAETSWPVQVFIDALNRASLYELSDKQKQYKFKKYGMQFFNNKYLYDEKKDLVFTLLDKGEFDLILTVTKGRGNFLKK